MSKKQKKLLLSIGKYVGYSLLLIGIFFMSRTWPLAGWAFAYLSAIYLGISEIIYFVGWIIDTYKIKKLKKEIAYIQGEINKSSYYG